MSWKSAQSALREAGLSKKEAISLTTVRRCLKDLEQLKACGGPVTSPEEVNRLVSDANISEVEKQNRLFTEVRYARDTSLSLPKASPLFSLMYKYKKLPVETMERISEYTSAKSLHHQQPHGQTLTVLSSG